VKFCIGIHNHQPVGNFGWVIEDAYQKSYFAFLELLSKYPSIRISLHFTGILYDWMKQNHPECLNLIRSMVQRGQIELLTGGFDEPILPAIPDRDKIGQIRMQSDFIEHEFGVRPSGLWLAERVWEPGLPKYLNEAGVKYTILDDIHFRYAGLEESALNGYYVTEDQGYQVALFPIAKKLRYTIPFADPEDTIAYLRSLATESGNSLAVYADDGEKFGVWPKTYEHCFVNGWLERFLKMLADNLNWIEMVTFSEALATIPAKGRVYLPTASYSEMNEWAMPVRAIEQYNSFVNKLKSAGLYDTFESFVKGGFWRNFQTKYEESNNLHKRMLYVSDLLERHRGTLPAETYESARKLLYAGQCNCPYWHGVFGGLYLPHLRGALFQQLVAAEAIIRRALQSGKSAIEIEERDYNCDGRDEILVTTRRIKAILNPDLGGAISEFDHFGVAKNLVDIVGRRKEGYHEKLLHRDAGKGSETKSIHDLVLVKEEGLESFLVEDQYQRGWFIDHFFADSASLRSFEAGTAGLDHDVTLQPYTAGISESPDAAVVTLTGVGKISSERGDAQFEIRKSIEFTTDGESVVASYKIANKGRVPVKLNFGCEIGLGSFPFPNTESFLIVEDGGRLKLDSAHELPRCLGLSMYGRLYSLLVTIKLSKTADFWTHPLWTVSLSEGGFEKVMQGSIIVPRWRVEVAPGDTWETEVRVECAIGVPESALSPALA
jgi:hypothetical protein